MYAHSICPFQMALADRIVCCRCTGGLPASGQRQRLCHFWLLQQPRQDHATGHGSLGEHPACCPKLKAASEEQAFRLRKVRAAVYSIAMTANVKETNKHIAWMAREPAAGRDEDFTASGSLQHASHLQMPCQGAYASQVAVNDDSLHLKLLLQSLPSEVYHVPPMSQ